MHHAWPDCKLLVFNTHLDAFDERFKRLQLQEMVPFIRNTINDMNKTMNFTRTAALIIGDLNIKASSNLYHECLLPLLHPAPFLIDYYKIKHPENKSYTYDPDDNPLAEISSCGGRIDYILGISQLGDFNFMPLKCLDFQISKRDVLSDHWPIYAAFIPAIQ